ncbi:hypothetical protein [Nesterenkonia sp. PF2B19]|uniref:hypothetical protein n=1 Tax=unclassified Nesterenkonia TaxID=2629769 RepID=UPI00111C258B|nr:hypothetical protein [Nesterenkonia sp. PF2B19]
MEESRAHPLRGDQEQAFEESCRSAIERLSEAVDLVLIHNEREVRGDQPRRVLNPMIVLLAFSALERQLVDLHHLGRGRQWHGPGTARTPHGRSVFAAEGDDGWRAILAGLTRSRLPEELRVRVFSGWRGRSPQGPRLVTGALGADGSPGDLDEELRRWRTTRNGIAHHCLPQQMAHDDHLVPLSDAATERTTTIQAGAARACLATMVQLVDQITVHVAAAADFPADAVPRPPGWWFADDPPQRVRGVRDPGRLWGPHDLPRGLVHQLGR